MHDVPYDANMSPLQLPLARPFRKPAERVLGLTALNAVHDGAIRRMTSDNDSYYQRVLDHMGITVDVDADALDRIPREGPVFVVANHPYGGIDGIVLGAMLLKIRPDVRLVVNSMLRILEPMRANSIFVNPFGGENAARTNRGPMREILAWLRRGGLATTFPSGEVSHRTWRRRAITDPPWNETIARLILRSRATVVPIFFEGRNSAMFQGAGMLHPRLRTALLPREMLRHTGSTVRVAVGPPIPAKQLETMGSADAVTAHLRVRTYVLRPGATSKPAPSVMPAIEPPGDANRIAADFDRLPESRHLAGKGDLVVAYASADEIPDLMHEIGRQREIAFRAVGEGTGLPVDIDRFDAWYTQLILWDRRHQRLAGAYRLGLTDVILDEHGVDGLYTSTLFNYSEALLEQMSPAMEMGRSFVVPDYQRAFQPLVLLWRAIATYSSRSPRYRRLFGPVSISADYQSMSKMLLLAFLERTRFLPSLGNLLKPRAPVRQQPPRDWACDDTTVVVQDLRGVDDLIRQLESGERGVPVLLRQYLKLNAKLLGFNVDADFGDVVDALLLIDLIEVDRRVLNFYMGRDAAEQFRSVHRATTRC